MATPGSSEYKPRDHLSISTLVAADRCLRKSFYQRVDLGPERTGLPLLFGKAMHKALPEATTKGVEDALNAFNSVWTDPPDGELDKKRNPERAEAMLKDFAAQHTEGSVRYKLIDPPEALKVKSEEDDVSPWELNFAVDSGLNIPLTGRIDSLAHWLPTDEIFAVEYKTSSEISDRLLRGLTFNPQIVGYPSVLRRLGLTVAGTLPMLIRVSPSREETAITPIYISEDQSKAFWEWVRYVGSLILACEQTETWPQSMSACTPYSQYGMPGYMCPFAPLCHETDDWRTLRTLFTEV